MTDTSGPSDSSPFQNVLTSDAALREFYREPSEVVQEKTIPYLDQTAKDFIAQATFVMIGTSNGTQQNVSPKGGPAGFIKVIDDGHLAIPDLNGNNRLDGLRDITVHPHVGLVFVIPGMKETLRVNGDACVSVDDDVLDLFTDEVRRPKSSIGVTVRTAFLHCGKAFLRGGIWAPDMWVSESDQPSPGEMLIAHAAIDGISSDELDTSLAASYDDDLAADQPE